MRGTANGWVLGTGEVYKAAGFPDVRFSRLNKDRVDQAVLDLGVNLRELFPDIRRCQGWFPRWALWRRHKTRGKSGGPVYRGDGRD